MATYTKETALYDTGAIAQDIQEAGNQVNKYITAIGDDGIKVHPYNSTTGTADTKNYTKIDSDGMEIWQDVDGVSTKVADFGADETTIGRTNETYLSMDYHSLTLIDKDYTNPYLYISDLRDKNDNYLATITEVFTGDGVRTTFNVDLLPSASVSATDSSSSSNVGTWDGEGTYSFRFTTAPPDSATVQIIYKTTSELAKAYSLGYRLDNIAIGPMSIVEGVGNAARGFASHAEGRDNLASGDSSHAEGAVTTASDNHAHAEGYYTTASRESSHAEGNGTTASGQASHAEGGTTTASGKYAHAEGEDTTASGQASHAEGYDTDATHNYSHAEGNSTTASGQASHAEGETTTASGKASHAEGSNSNASREFSHAEGEHTSAGGRAAHAEGGNTVASAHYSHAQNQYTIASKTAQTAIGRYNIEDTATTADQKALIIGNGTSTSARSNALTVDWKGRVQCGDYAGTLTSIFDIFYPVGSYYDTSDSSFDPSTSLGGTWSSEVIVDDEIVEQGTNSIWTYRKWKSGIAECWGRRDVTISLNNNYGGAYYGTDGVSFPTDLFSAEPTVSVSRQGRQGTGLVHISPYSVSSTQMQYFVTNTNGRYDSAPIGIAINARGLWKTYSAPSKKYRWHRTA